MKTINEDSSDGPYSESELNIDASENGEESSNKVELPPVEGVRAWLVVTGSFLMHWVVLGDIYTVGLFLPIYEEIYQKSRQELVIIGTLQIGLLFGSGVFSGKLADRYGVRKIFGIGLVAHTVGLLCASFATKFWQLVLFQGVLTGIGQGFLYWPGVTVVPMWFTKRRGLATGMAVVGAGVGQFSSSFLTQNLLESHGPSFTLRILTLYSGLMLLIANFLLARRVPLEKTITLLSGWGIFRERKFVLLFFGGVMFQFGFHIVFAHLPAYLDDEGIGDANFLALAVGLAGIGSAVGRVVLGWLSDILGRLFLGKYCILFTAVTFVSWLWCTTEASILAFAFLYGFFSGAFIALIFPIIGDFFGVSRLGDIGGFMSLGMIPGSFIGPYMAGKLYDSNGNYDNAIIVGSVFLFISALSFFLLPKPDFKDDDEAKIKGVTHESGERETNQTQTQAQNETNAKVETV